MGGSLLSDASEKHIKSAGGRNLTITLQDDTWTASVGEYDGGQGPTSLLLAGLTSQQEEKQGWNHIVKQRLSHIDVMR